VTKKQWNAFLIVILLSAPALARADALADAFTLLRITNIAQQFDAKRAQQTRDIIRTYTLIVTELSATQLPQSIKAAITQCYEESYDFGQFERGIADILVKTFSAKELELLVDFHSDLALPPSQIKAFRDIVAKAKIVQTTGAEFIYNNSEGCVQKGANLVIDYLNSQPLSTD